jgi:hypothetical protein
VSGKLLKLTCFLVKYQGVKKWAEKAKFTQTSIYGAHAPGITSH